MRKINSFDAVEARAKTALLLLLGKLSASLVQLFLSEGLAPRNLLFKIDNICFGILGVD